MTLFQQIHLAWENKCEISFYSKYSFIAQFYDHVEYETSVLGSSLVLGKWNTFYHWTWFQNFELLSMLVTRMLV